MAKFKIIVSDPETGKSQALEVEGARAVPIVGRRLGEIIEGTSVGMPGYKLRISGGSDKDGFPMRPNIHGGVRVSVILSEGTGFHPSRAGERQRKTLRGNVVTEDIVQVNMKVVEKPKKKEKMPKRKKKKNGGESTEKAAQTTRG